MNLAIIQARMSSTRLPGKVLRPILGRAMLGHQLDRLRRATLIDRLVLATSQETSDDLIAAFGEAEGIAVHRGSLNDVLDRFHSAANEYGPADNIIRLTADCPLTDWRIIDACIELHKQRGADYTSNSVDRTYPDGLDVEIMRNSVLDLAWANATSPSEREHVTAYIYRHPELFRIAQLTQTPDLGALRWTVDTLADFDMVTAVFGALHGSNLDFGQEDVLRLLAQRPDIAQINA
jgi:spore coat polysaccharide biosynthesis protein SpsF